MQTSELNAFVTFMKKKESAVQNLFFLGVVIAA